MVIKMYDFVEAVAGFLFDHYNWCDGFHTPCIAHLGRVSAESFKQWCGSYSGRDETDR